MLQIGYHASFGMRGNILIWYVQESFFCMIPNLASRHKAFLSTAWSTSNRSKDQHGWISSLLTCKRRMRQDAAQYVSTVQDTMIWSTLTSLSSNKRRIQWWKAHDAICTMGSSFMLLVIIRSHSLSFLTSYRYTCSSLNCCLVFTLISCATLILLMANTNQAAPVL